MSQHLYNRKRFSRAGSDDSSTSDDASSSSLRSAMEGASNFRTADRPNRMAAGTGQKLAQEIHDEFLVCKICLESYRNPKCLNCLHTFCEQCIENHVMSEPSYKKYSDYREFTCPLCRKRTQLPVGGVKKLPDNFLVSSLIETVGRQKPSAFPFCDICKLVNRKHREATSKCLDCAKLLCRNCVQLHRETKVTSAHSIFDVEIEKDIECKEHQEEVVRFYCEPCDACICVLCTFNEHKDHEITNFGDAVVKYKDNIQGLLNNCRTKIEMFDTQMEAANKCEEIIKAVQQRIHDSAIEFIQEIRNREKQLMEELQNIYGPACVNYIEGKKDMSIQVESLRSTCNLTEVILMGKDIELLLLKREVEEKLNALNTVEIQKLPSTISKIVNFVSGAVDFGYIHDHDRPLLSKMRTGKRPSTDDNGDNRTSFEVRKSNTSKEIQTEPVIIKEKGSESDEDESSDDDADSDNSEKDSSESESEDEKPDTTEAEVQTEVTEATITTSKNIEEKCTMTDIISTEEKGINTRSRCLQSQPGSQPGPTAIRSPPPDANDESPDNTLAARRRRRRDRSLNTNSVDMSDTTLNNGNDAALSFAERRKLRSHFSFSNSIDGEDMFYDAAPPLQLSQKHV